MSYDSERIVREWHERVARPKTFSALIQSVRRWLVKWV